MTFEKDFFVLLLCFISCFVYFSRKVGQKYYLIFPNTNYEKKKHITNKKTFKQVLRNS